MKTESKATHTPGPWYASERGNEFGVFAKDDGAERIIALELFDEEACPPTQEIEANARLIAAAPELLAALNRALPWLGRLIADGGHLNSVAPNDAIGAMNQAQAAIDRALGHE